MKLGIILALCFSARIAVAQTCEAGSPQDELQYLRRLSLDLRGRVPSYEELKAVADSGAIDPAAIDAMIASDSFVQRMRGVHRDLLWTNISDQRLAGNTWRLRAPGRTGPTAYYISSNGRASRYRGTQTSCLDEPARFDANTGAILTTPDPMDSTIEREGWVEVHPYWDLSATIKVCAFDAQENLTGRDAQNRMVDCSSSINSRECGCGPNLRWCESNSDGTRPNIVESMNEQLLRFVDHIVEEDRPYTDLLLAKDMEINGPISHWLRYQTMTAGGDGLIATPEQNYPVPELDFQEIGTWTRIERGERHAGVLTMPGYLVKFPSDRGRANRFYNAFLCQHFEASSELPPATDVCHQEPDLTKRCGCKDCHVAVEPAAAYWGRWGEAGLVPLNEDRFPKVNGCCVDGGMCSPEDRRIFNANYCARFYYTARDLTGPSDPTSIYLGMLKSYVFADQARERSIEQGPEGIARAAIDSGAFAQCTVTRMWRQFLARDPLPEEAQTISELSEKFKDGYNLKALIKELVTRPEYIAAGRFGSAE